MNGSAKIVTDKKVLELLECEGKIPTFAIIVNVNEAFIHCAKCMIRSKLWSSNNETKQANIPSLAKSLVDHGKLEIAVKELDDLIKNDEKNNLY